MMRNETKSRRSLHPAGTVMLTVVILMATGFYLGVRSWGTARIALTPRSSVPLAEVSGQLALVEEARARDRAVAEAGDPERDPFQRPRRAATTRTHRPAPKPVALTPPDLRFVLYDQVSPEVQISVDGALSGRLKLGQTFSGWTVKSISARTCVVEKDGRTFTLSSRR